MINSPLHHIKSELQSFAGRQLNEVHRLFYEEVEDELQLIDGHVFLIFDNAVQFRFFAFTEKFSLYYCKSSPDDRPRGTVDISTDQFWKNRLKVPIKEVQLIWSVYTPDPYGIRFILDNDEQFALEYVSDDGDVFDALVITEGI